jgi:hypothetical protein
MQRSENINELAAALAKAQGAMAAASKDGSNPHLRVKYVTLGAIWEAARQALSANALAVTQSPALDRGAVTIETLLMHASGQWCLSSLAIPCPRAEPQAVGAAITYARKYALAAMVGVAPEDEESALLARAGKPGMARDEQIAEVWRVSSSLEQEERVTRAAINRTYGVGEPYLLTEAQAELFLVELRGRLAQRNGSKASDATRPPAALPPSTPPAGGAAATLQEALAGVQREDVARAAAVQPPEDQAMLDLFRLRDSLFALAPPLLGPGEDRPAAEARAWRAILSKRGVAPLLPPPPEVVRELTATLDAKIQSLAAKAIDEGSTCAVKEAPAVTQGAKSPPY